ncbi:MULTISPECIES: hypothetical protein [Parapedobacter]|nr:MULTISPECIES: hypothetical protein [Parapedobacter]
MIDIRKSSRLLENKVVRIGLFALSAYAIYAFGKSMGEFIYYLLH